jgi:hypothetical protein
MVAVTWPELRAAHRINGGLRTHVQAYATAILSTYPSTSFPKPRDARAPDIGLDE